MKILLTGGCGFIGSFVCEKLVSEFPDATICVIDALYDCASSNNIQDIKNKIHLCIGNIQNKDLLNELFNQYKFDYVIHMAAQTHVDNSFHTPLQFTLDNVLGTHTLLEVAREQNCIKRFMYVSTDEVYGSTSMNTPNTVESLLEPSNPYAATKASAEMLVKSYIHSFKLPAFIVRMNNVYGPRQYPEKMIPNFIYANLCKNPILIHGSGEQKRSMLYVEDAADALVCVFKNARINQIVNIPSLDEFTVLEVSKKVCEFMNVDHTIEYVLDRPFNDTRYWIYDDQLKDMGWKQLTSFEEGLRKTIDWYKKHDKLYWKL
jgi:UDP-glucose 4,6-dehydratase